MELQADGSFSCSDMALLTKVVLLNDLHFPSVHLIFEKRICLASHLNAMKWLDLSPLRGDIVL